MKYMLLTYLDERVWGALTPAEQQHEMDKCAPHVQSLLKSGKFLGGAPLEATTAATTVKYRGGRRLITDGPFAETREQLGGYAIIEATDLDDAIRIAEGFVQESEIATIEVRPIVVLADPPAVIQATGH